jgi:hypothetical protein
LDTILPTAFGGNRARWLEAIQPLLTQADKDVVDELRGMAESSGVSLEDLQLVNFASYVASIDTQAPSSAACSVLASAGSANEKDSLLIGRQQDMVATEAPPVIIVRHFNDRRPAQLELTQPALLEIAAAITANGLFLEGHPAFTKETIPAHATDLFSLIGTALRSARSLDDLEQALTSRPRLKAMNATLADLTAGEVHALELSSSRSALNKPDKNGILVSTNHFLSPDLDALRPPTVNRSLIRFDRLSKLAIDRLGHITAEEMQAFLHDPEVSDGTGITLIVNADAGYVRLWDQTHGRWFELALADVFGSSSVSQ